jgi:hypothetical protein
LVSPPRPRSRHTPTLRPGSGSIDLLRDFPWRSPDQDGIPGPYTKSAGISDGLGETDASLIAQAFMSKVRKTPSWPRSWASFSIL